MLSPCTPRCGLSRPKSILIHLTHIKATLLFPGRLSKWARPSVTCAQRTGRASNESGVTVIPKGTARPGNTPFLARPSHLSAASFPTSESQSRSPPVTYLKTALAGNLEKEFRSQAGWSCRFFFTWLPPFPSGNPLTLPVQRPSVGLPVEASG